MMVNPIKSPIKAPVVNPFGKDFWLPRSCRACWMFDGSGKKVLDLANTASTVIHNNEAVYNPDTWNEWATKVGVTISAVGARFTGDGVNIKYMSLDNCHFKNATKYGCLYEVVDSTITGAFRLAANLTGATFSLHIGNGVGDMKAIFTTQAVVTSNMVSISTSSSEAGALTIRKFRIFELQPGSEIEADFASMNRYALALKYPWSSAPIRKLVYNHATNYGATPKGEWYSLDGVDDYFTVANTPALDITTGQFVFGATFRLATVGAGSSFIICKNLDNASNAQYALYCDMTAKKVTFYWNGGARCNTGDNSIVEGVWYNVIFHRNAEGVITPILNKVEKLTATYALDAVSQPYLRIGRRETNLGRFKGDIGNVSIYAASKLDIREVVEHQKMIASKFGIAA